MAIATFTTGYTIFNDAPAPPPPPRPPPPPPAHSQIPCVLCSYVRPDHLVSGVKPALRVNMALKIGRATRMERL